MNLNPNQVLLQEILYYILPYTTLVLQFISGHNPLQLLCTCTQSGHYDSLSASPFAQIGKMFACATSAVAA